MVTSFYTSSSYSCALCRRMHCTALNIWVEFKQQTTSNVMTRDSKAMFCIEPARATKSISADKAVLNKATYSSLCQSIANYNN